MENLGKQIQKYLSFKHVLLGLFLLGFYACKTKCSCINNIEILADRFASEIKSYPSDNVCVECVGNYCLVRPKGEQGYWNAVPFIGDGAYAHSIRLSQLSNLEDFEVFQKCLLDSLDTKGVRVSTVWFESYPDTITFEILGPNDEQLYIYFEYVRNMNDSKCYRLHKTNRQ